MVAEQGHCRQQPARRRSQLLPHTSLAHVRSNADRFDADQRAPGSLDAVRLPVLDLETGFARREAQCCGYLTACLVLRAESNGVGVTEAKMHRLFA